MLDDLVEGLRRRRFGGAECIQLGALLFHVLRADLLCHKLLIVVVYCVIPHFAFFYAVIIRWGCCELISEMFLKC